MGHSQGTGLAEGRVCRVPISRGQLSRDDKDYEVGLARLDS